MAKRTYFFTFLILLSLVMVVPWMHSIRPVYGAADNGGLTSGPGGNPPITDPGIGGSSTTSTGTSGTTGTSPGTNPSTGTTDSAAGKFDNGAQPNNLTVWGYIANTATIVTIWKLSLGLVDFIVVAGLIVASFANIFRIRIDTYGVKTILPGLIIGIILANLSYVIMHFMIEFSTFSEQFIGEIASSYLGNDLPIGSGQAGSYLAIALINRFFNSLVFLNPWFRLFSAAPLLKNAPIAAISYNAAGVIGSVIGLVLFAVAAIILLLVFLWLMFLLYIRSYVLMVLFMISPLAFFALGFPPLKRYWQLWWGNFWKWLIMAPTCYVLIAFAVIYLNSATKGQDPSKGFNWIDYFIVNGIASAIVYTATRIPFMWGSLFNMNVMQRWNNLGKKVAPDRESVKRSIDYGARVRANIKTGQNDLLGLRTRPSEAKLLEMLGHKTPTEQANARQKIVDLMPGATNTQITEEIRRRAADEEFRKGARRNIFRQGQGALNVLKNWQTEQQKADARFTRQSPEYQNKSFQYTKSTFVSEQFDRQKNEYQDNQDVKGVLLDKVDDLHDFFVRGGFTAPGEAEKKIRTLINTSSDSLARAFDDLPLARELDQKGLEKLIDQIAAARQFRSATNTLYGKTAARRVQEEAFSGGKAAVTFPYAPPTQTGNGGAAPNANTAATPGNNGGNQNGGDMGNSGNGGTGPNGTPPSPANPGLTHVAIQSISDEAAQTLSDNTSLQPGQLTQAIGAGLENVASDSALNALEEEGPDADKEHGFNPYASAGKSLSVSLDRVAESAASAIGSKWRLDEATRNAISAVPMGAMRQSMSLLTKQEMLTRSLLVGRGLNPRQIQQVLARTRLKALDRKATSLGSASTLGLQPDQLTNEIKTALQGYGRSVRGVEKVLYNSISDDSPMARARILAETIQLDQPAGLRAAASLGLPTAPRAQLHNELGNLQSQLVSDSIPAIVPSAEPLSPAEGPAPSAAAPSPIFGQDIAQGAPLAPSSPLPESAPPNLAPAPPTVPPLNSNDSAFGTPASP